VKRSAPGGFEYSAVRFYAANVLMAFKHLHDKSIAYRDLKPENLLMNSNGYLKVLLAYFSQTLLFPTSLLSVSL
jgi:serine/threonine protein kinase